MVDNALKSGIRTALRLHEIGDASPYKLFFAGKGKSGGSFGFMQGDLAAGQPEVKKTFEDVLAAAGVAPARIAAIEAPLSIHCIDNPLSKADTMLVNAALASEAGRPLVDAMDERILGGVYGGLDRCVAAARSGGRTIEPKAILYMAMWINMSGPPSTLTTWLSGKSVTMATTLKAPGAAVDGTAMESYLRATNYYTENPANLPHAMQCAAAGAAAFAS